MSGGEYGYIHLKVEEFADNILQPYKIESLDSMKNIGKGAVRGNMPLREVFSEFLMDVAQAMALLEKADSGDINEDVAYQAIEELMFGDLDLDSEEVTPA